VATSDEESLEGRGREEMLPERGDPFLNHEDPSSSKERDETADVLPLGLERRQEADQAGLPNGDVDEYVMPRPGSRSHDDGSMHAVGSPLPEDLSDVSVPPPAVDPELPPPPDRDLTSLLDEQASFGRSRLAEIDIVPSSSEKSGSDKDSLLVSELRWKRLYAKADLLRERMGKEIENPHLRRLLLDQVAIACDRSLKTREEFDESERILNEVEGRMHLEEQVQKFSASLKIWVLSYEILFAVLFVVGLFVLPNVVKDLFPRWFPEISSAALPDINTMIIAILWGGLGGIVSAMIGLWAHRALNQEIDRQWAIWFFANPFMGIVLGALIFLFLRAILLGLFPSTSGRFQFSWVLYVMAWVAGFEQNVFYDLIERGMKMLEPKKGEPKSKRRTQKD
jgi:heme/copper-type cytochrome/quinol oxidase subunit 3